MYWMHRQYWDMKKPEMDVKLKNIKEAILKVRYNEEDTQRFCLSPTNRWCNVHAAVPAMTGLMWYQINEIIFQKMCPGNCPNGECSIANNAEEMLKDLDRILYMSLFFSSVIKDTWDPFFQKALSVQAFTNLDSTLALIKDKKEDFEIAEGQCSVIKFQTACEYAAIFQNYNMLRKVQQKNGDVGQKVKDIRLYSDMDMKQMIQLQKDNLQHLELLGNIKKLDDNLKASVSGISRYDFFLW